MRGNILIRQSVILWLTGVTAFAGADQPSGVARQKHARRQTVVRESCYVLLSNSPFPQPCDRAGPVPSTASPMDIIGEVPRHIVRTTSRGK